ncbi:hypothetical protein DACRYDRAFT_112716 [Dacryopinax primogenitus]|uniref:Membrane-associated proteins in eicosanoid and glutathione metabolism n=1 Tax=Dacryopinax primogenitus (strain DJM 731) TaxID=1858805 RepID=M5FMY1_DACPD|nr:uncharacterized protein DACRYDRAFT_112716 [Dacryopinax primogenitus]EJT96485.1 hypothetical protein DACRYDRAFT_112716 [Dacryopinax primogenitus]
MASLDLFWQTLDTPGVALYALPIAHFLGFVPHVQKLMILRSAKDVPTLVMAEAARLEAAHANASENFPLLLGAVGAGLYAGLDTRVVNGFAVAYLVCRVVFNIAYANQTTHAVAGIRTVAYWTGTVWAMYIMVLAGNTLARKAAL